MNKINLKAKRKQTINSMMKEHILETAVEFLKQTKNINNFTMDNIAKFAGYFQILLAVIGFVEVIRRFIGIEAMPDFKTMIIVSVLALIANVLCLYLLQKNKSKEAHMQASMIFTSNDVIINSGVIVAGILVNWLNSSYPDLIIGAIVFVVVARGAYRILKLAK